MGTGPVEVTPLVVVARRIHRIPWCRGETLLIGTKVNKIKNKRKEGKERKIRKGKNEKRKTKNN